LLYSPWLRAADGSPSRVGFTLPPNTTTCQLGTASMANPQWFHLGMPNAPESTWLHVFVCVSNANRSSKHSLEFQPPYTINVVRTANIECPLLRPGGVPATSSSGFHANVSMSKL